MDIIYRQGKKEDSQRIAELDYIASDGAAEYLFHDLIPNVSPIQIVASGLENDLYPHSYRSTIVAEYDQTIVGMSLSFPAELHRITEEMRQSIPADRLDHFKDFFSTRVEGSYLLDALCVDQAYRGKGIGSTLIELTKEKARQEGYKVISLIVFADNQNAQALYLNHGFSVVKPIDLPPHALMPHQGGCLLMKADI